MIPACSVPIATSSSARIIPWDSMPRSFALPSLVPSGITAPGLATATVWPAATLGAPHTIRWGAPLADVDQAHAQAVGVRMLVGLEHAADDEVIERGHAVVVDRLDLGAGHRQAVGERVRVERRVDVLAEPLERNAHQPNCSRKRTSLS